MADDDAQQLIQKLLLQALSRRLSQSQWLTLLHQLVRRVEASQDAFEDDDAPSLAASYAAGCLVRYILSQSFIDPLLIEYLQAVIYGSANRSGIAPDQGPITDVITVTLHLLANVKAEASNVPAIETISSIIGQGLLMTFQSSVPFRVANSSFLILLQRLFSDQADEVLKVQDDLLSPAALSFIVSNLRLLALAADSTISSPQNLLAPRVAITVLINIGQALLAHTIQRLSSISASKDAKLKPDDDALTRIQAMAKTSVAEIEAVLQSMNPAWKDEIALLRSLTSQIGVIEQLSETLSASTTATASRKSKRRKAETLQDAQGRASWDHFLDTLPAASSSATAAAPSKPPVEPEMALLLHLLVDTHTSWDAKLNAVKTLFLARRDAAAPSLTLEKSLTSFYYELLVAAIDACASVVEQPAAFKGAEVYASIWRNALCGMVPEVVLQLEQWLDAHPDLPLRGQRLEAPHVRLESALRAALLVMAERLNVCESAGNGSTAGVGVGAGTEAMMNDVVGLDTPPSQPVKAYLLRAFIEHSLARPEAIADEFPDGHKLASEVQNLPQSLRMDAQLEGLNLQTLFETRISTDDPMELLHRVGSDPGTHFVFAKQLVLQMQGWLEQKELESASRWCKALSEEAGAGLLDTVMMYIEAIELVGPLGGVLDEDEVGQTSDEPSTLSNMLLFVQLLCYRYSIPASRIPRSGASQHDAMEVEDPTPRSTSTPFLATYLASTPTCPSLSTLSEDERNLVGRWIHALFGNEGISDDLISLSPPRTLLRLSPLLFSQSIYACNSGVIDLETLRGGLSYFLQDLLVFALPSALMWLLGELTRAPVEPILDFLASAGLAEGVVDVPSADGTLANGLARNANTRTVGLEVVALLLGSEACPGSVREVVAAAFDAFVRAVEGEKRLEEGCETFRLQEVKARMEAAGLTAKLLSRRAGGWLKVLANQTHAAGGESRVVSLLCGLDGSSGGLERLVRVLGRGEAKGGMEQKAVAAWTALVAPTVKADGGADRLLAFVHKLDFASMEEGAVEGVVRTLGLILALIKAAEAVRQRSTEGGGDDGAAMVLALAGKAGGEGGKEHGNADSTGADLFDDEPSTPPLPSTAGAATNAAGAAAGGGGVSVATRTVASIVSSPDFAASSDQLLDLLALKLVRFKTSLKSTGRADRGRAAKWAALDRAIVDNLGETSPLSTLLSALS